MTITAEDIRCDNDIAFYEKLKKNKDVRKVNQQIARQEAEGPSGIRRNLLATSVRLTPRMSPDIARIADECIKLLGVQLPLELYVYSSPQFNAACFKPEEDRLYVMFSSSLLEGFEEDELKFVMGHELGHHVYNHHAIPIGYLMNGGDTPSRKLALELFAWSRYAEISADRAGAHCAQNMDAVARALFKLSSGLTSKKIIQFSLDDFVAQVDDMQMEGDQMPQGSAQSDWFSTHPFSPLRVKALKLFEQSSLYQSKSGINKVNLEVAVQSIMGLMEPSYLESKTDVAEAMRRLLFTGLICVADADGHISQKEIDVFNAFFGEYAFKEELHIEKIKHTLSERLREAKKKMSYTQAMQVVRDLCLMVNADHKIHEKEVKVLNKIAQKLELPSSIVSNTLHMHAELD